jgi:hypothetical protein
LIIAFIIGSCFLYTLIVKPEYVAVVFFTVTIADMNVTVEGLPINLRALLGLALFARTLVPMKMEEHESFFATPAKYIIIFLIYTMVLSAFYDLLDVTYARTCALTFISSYTGYFFFFKYNDTRLLKASLLIAGLICLSDLVFTYATEGSFPVIRVYKHLLGIPETYNEHGEIVEAINWGFYGLICGMSFVVLLTDYINGKLTSKIGFILMPVMFLGVLMSTSRSALLGVAGISFFIMAREFNHQARWKRAASLLMIIFSALVISLIVFMSIQSLFSLNTDFMDEITLRLIDEPIAVLNKHLGLNYNVHSLGAMEWRTEASSDALGAFLNLKNEEEFFGIGFWGYVTRNLGHNNLPPHNGLLMILIEFGIVGLVYWTMMIYSFLFKSFRVSDMTSPLSVSIIFIILFSLANNAELTGSIMFLFVSTLIAENIFFEQSQAKVVSLVQT